MKPTSDSYRTNPIPPNRAKINHLRSPPEFIFGVNTHEVAVLTPDYENGLDPGLLSGLGWRPLGSTVELGIGGATSGNKTGRADVQEPPIGAATPEE